MIPMIVIDDNTNKNIISFVLKFEPPGEGCFVMQCMCCSDEVNCVCGSICVVFLFERFHNSPNTSQDNATWTNQQVCNVLPNYPVLAGRSTSDQYLINTQFGSQGENHVRTILEILNKLDNIVQTGECIYIYIVYTDTQ